MLITKLHNLSNCEGQTVLLLDNDVEACAKINGKPFPVHFKLIFKGKASSSSLMAFRRPCQKFFVTPHRANISKMIHLTLYNLF